MEEVYEIFMLCRGVVVAVAVAVKPLLLYTTTTVHYYCGTTRNCILSFGLHAWVREGLKLVM